MLGSKLYEVGPNKKPLIWFAHHDVLVGSMLPLATPELVFVAEVYNEWYSELFDFFIHGQLPTDQNKVQDIRLMAAWYLIPLGA